jgi:alkanesulfonate monooxygenase SsuD/methylene tetrahydromethanopterin reductase-like flavin-dependent oxidoreductase (luciferase family)
MRIGISPFASSRDGARRVAATAVEGGIDTIWLGDGLLEVHAFPMWSGGLEPFVELAYFAGRHPGIRVALGAAVLPLRDVQWVAKQAATLDQLTEGNFVLAVTPGYWEREFRYRGLRFEERGRRFEELVGALRAAWAGHAYETDSARLPADGRLSPVPATPGGPPLWYAGGRATFERALRDAVPYQTPPTPPDRMRETAGEWFDRGGTDLAVRIALEFGDRVSTSGDVLRGPAPYLLEQLVLYRSIGVVDVSIMPGRDDATSLRTVEVLASEVLPRLSPQPPSRPAPPAGLVRGGLSERSE